MSYMRETVSKLQAALPDEPQLTHNNAVLEVRQFWRHQLVRVLHLKAPSTLTVGDEPGATFHLHLAQPGTFTLAEKSSEGWQLQPPEGVTGEITDGAKRLQLAQVTQRPITLGLQGQAVVHFGDVAIAMRPVAPAAPLQTTLWQIFDSAYLNLLILSLALHLAVGMSLLLNPHDTTTLKIDLFDQPNRFAALITKPNITPKSQKLYQKIAKEVAKRQEQDQAKQSASTAKAHGQRAKGVRTPEPHKVDVQGSFSTLLGGKSGGMGSTTKGGGGGSLSGTLQNVVGSAGKGSASAGLSGLGSRSTGPATGGGTGESRGIAGLGNTGRFGGGKPGLGGVGAGAGGLHRGPELDFDTPSIQGALSADVIRRVVQQNRNQVRYCYEVQLQGQQDLQGRIVVHWVIGPDGRVLSANIKESSMHNPAVENCLLQKIKTWQFPAPAGGGSVEVNYPFVFRAS